MRKQVLFIFVICVMVSGLVQPISGTDYYVNDGWDGDECWTLNPGDDGTGDGSQATPYATIQHVIDTHVLGPGDRIFVDEGTYNEMVDITSADLR